MLIINSPLFNGEIQNTLRSLLTEKFLLEFTNEGYEGLDATRIEIFSRAINLLQNNPFFGIGATSFTEIYHLETNFWKGHSHNLLLERRTYQFERSLITKFSNSLAALWNSHETY